MTDVQTVIVQLKPDQVTEGHFIVEGEMLVMTFDDGTPVDPPHRHKLRLGDDPHAIAGMLTKEVRRALSGEKVPGFNDSLRYANQGYA